MLFGGFPFARFGIEKYLLDVCHFLDCYEGGI